MIDITLEQIRSAADKSASDHLTAFGVVLDALAPRIGQVANKYATSGGIRNADLAEELEQIGRIAAWQCIERFTGETVAQFFTYVDRSLNGALDAERRRETRQGVSEDTAKRFERCLSQCSGDPYAAEREAVRADGVLGRERMTPETAYAARLAWQGADYLDAPVHNGHTTLGALVAETFGVPADLVEAVDITRAERRAIRDAVHATLGRMGRQQAFVLRASYGIEPVPQMGSDREIADALGIEEHRITVLRWKAKARFRELYLAGAPTFAAELAA
jgi:RNA polymerase sigma factor (sigma-70 family)